MSNELLGCASCSRRCDIAVAFVAKRGVLRPRLLTDVRVLALPKQQAVGVGSVVVGAEREA